ncbi:MAG: hypothetical protein AAFX93_17750 [Verrucomicrobiota bacterium]
MNTFQNLLDQNIARFRSMIPDAVAQLNWNRAQIEAEQTRRLRQTLAHAKENSPFYAERLQDINPHNFTRADLPSIPVLTKEEVMTHWDQIVTDPRLSLAKANAHLERFREGETDNIYFLDEYYLCATGGSSGRRGLFLWDSEHFATTTAIMYRIDARRDQQRPPTRQRTAVICAGSYLHGSRMLFPNTADPERQLHIISAGTPIPEIVERLNTFQPDRLVSYSSVVEELCHTAKAGQLQIALQQIYVNSEPLSDLARRLSKKIWGIDIHNSWGSVELGIAGVEGDQFEGILLAEDYNVFEAFDESGKSIEEGPADHLVVTRLFNKTFPLIRYVMTDSPVMAKPGATDAPGYRRILELKGRSDVWFDYPDGPHLHPMVFRGILGQEASIIEYQVRQTSKGADVDLIVSDAPDLERIRRSLVDKLIAKGLKQPEVAIAVVSELIRHPETNKLSRFVALK